MGKVKRTLNIDDKVEDQLNKMSKKGVSRSFFCNQAIKDRLKKVGLW